MIIEVINKQSEKRKEIEKILELIDIILPKNYKIEKIDGKLCIVKGRYLFKIEIAELTLKEEIIEVCFISNFESELVLLRKYFEDSDTKFKLIIGEEYY